METTLVLLEESTVQCHQIFHDNGHWNYIWRHFLGQRRKIVSHSPTT